jgi:hypothetical protein
MRHTILPLCALACLLHVQSLRAAETLTETQKIEKLITTVAEMQGAKFIRNGKAYDGKDAAAHMRRKWEGGKNQIKTARDFITLAASKSERSGEPYLIRFDDGKEVKSADFLKEKLDEIEQSATQPS